MPVLDVVTASPEETEALAARLAAQLRPGDVVTLRGDLGAGKTTFVRGACRALGVTRPVTSPTFTIAHRYEGAGLDVSHLDLYRFHSVEPEEWHTLEPYLDGATCFVEWPEAGEGLLPAARVAVAFRHIDPAHRGIAIECAEESLLQRLRAC